jgi:hypothetical protein
MRSSLRPRLHRPPPPAAAVRVRRSCHCRTPRAHSGIRPENSVPTFAKLCLSAQRLRRVQPECPARFSSQVRVHCRVCIPSPSVLQASDSAQACRSISALALRLARSSCLPPVKPTGCNPPSRWLIPADTSQPDSDPRSTPSFCPHHLHSPARTTFRGLGRRRRPGRFVQLRKESAVAIHLTGPGDPWDRRSDSDS